MSICGVSKICNGNDSDTHVLSLAHFLQILSELLQMLKEAVYKSLSEPLIAHRNCSGETMNDTHMLF